MASQLSFQLTLLFNVQFNDNGGNWQYAGATAADPSTKEQTATLIATKRDNSHCNFNFPASMLTATVMFPPAKTGEVPPNLTLQGVHDLTTNNETGSVSAASPDLAAYIGGAFSFDATSGLLTISPGS